MSLSYVRRPCPLSLSVQVCVTDVCQKGCLSPPSRVGSLEHQRLLSFLHQRGVCAELSRRCQLPFPLSVRLFWCGGLQGALCPSKCRCLVLGPQKAHQQECHPIANMACGSQATRAWLSPLAYVGSWGFHPKCSCITFCKSTPLSVSCHCPAMVV